jgi:hypothetical protein
MQTRKTIILFILACGHFLKSRYAQFFIMGYFFLQGYQTLKDVFILSSVFHGDKDPLWSNRNYISTGYNISFQHYYIQYIWINSRLDRPNRTFWARWIMHKLNHISSIGSAIQVLQNYMGGIYPGIARGESPIFHEKCA